MKFQRLCHIATWIMAKVQHYGGLNTNLEKLYNDIKQLLEDQKDLQIVSEYKGTLNAVPQTKHTL
jgi:hypothetical protein